jgi:hypothetical protein
MLICKIKKNKVLTALKISSIFIIILYFSLFLINIQNKHESNSSEQFHCSQINKDKSFISLKRVENKEINSRVSYITEQKVETERRITFCSEKLQLFRDYIREINVKKYNNGFDSFHDKDCNSNDEAFIKYSYLGVVFILGAFINVKECLKLGIL